MSGRWCTKSSSRLESPTACRSGAGSSRTCLSLPRAYVDKLKAIGGGISLVGGWRYISGTAVPSGPPFRMILDSGIRSGLSSDGMQISPMNPWLGMYYAVTGRNARGVLINPGQQITRQEALRLYTADNGWFIKEEATLGSIELGKKADLTVLSGTTSIRSPCPTRRSRTSTPSSPW